MLFNDFRDYVKVRRGAIHIGGHVGEERAWYKNMRFSRVLWFEPNAELIGTLKENISVYHDQKAYGLGIHDTLKSASLHIACNNGMSSSILDLGTHAKHYPKIHYIRDQEIRLMRMDDFFVQEKLDINDYNFVNIDVQGVELNVIKSFGSLIKNIDYVYLEVNEEEVYKGCALTKDIDRYLGKYNFRRMITKMTPYKWGDALYVRYDEA